MEGHVAPNHSWCHKTRVILLPHSENRMILSSFVWVQYQRVTDGQRDGRTDGIAVGITAIYIASNVPLYSRLNLLCFLVHSCIIFVLFETEDILQRRHKVFDFALTMSPH